MVAGHREGTTSSGLREERDEIEEQLDDLPDEEEERNHRADRQRVGSTSWTAEQKCWSVDEVEFWMSRAAVGWWPQMNLSPIASAGEVDGDIINISVGGYVRARNNGRPARSTTGSDRESLAQLSDGLRLSFRERPNDRLRAF